MFIILLGIMLVAATWVGALWRVEEMLLNYTVPGHWSPWMF